MKAIVLAAGLGKRLQPLTDSVPKCLVEVNNKSLLENILDNLIDVGVKETWIVTGYLANKVTERIGNRYRDMTIHYVENVDYDSTNNIYSLALALRQVDDDIILSECDLYYDSGVFHKLLSATRDCTVLTSPYNPETMNGTVVTLNKDSAPFMMWINQHQRQSENFEYSKAFKTVNVYWMSQAFAVDRLLPHIESYMRLYNMNSYYELIIGALMYLGNDRFDMVEVSENEWAEVDDLHDLEIARKRFGH